MTSRPPSCCLYAPRYSTAYTPYADWWWVHLIRPFRIFSRIPRRVCIDENVLIDMAHAPMWRGTCRTPRTTHWVCSPFGLTLRTCSASSNKSGTPRATSLLLAEGRCCCRYAGASTWLGLVLELVVHSFSVVATIVSAILVAAVALVGLRRRRRRDVRLEFVGAVRTRKLGERRR